MFIQVFIFLISLGLIVCFYKNGVKCHDCWTLVVTGQAIVWAETSHCGSASQSQDGSTRTSDLLSSFLYNGEKWGCVTDLYLCQWLSTVSALPACLWQREVIGGARGGYRRGGGGGSAQFLFFYDQRLGNGCRQVPIRDLGEVWNLKGYGWPKQQRKKNIYENYIRKKGSNLKNSSSLMHTLFLSLCSLTICWGLTLEKWSKMSILVQNKPMCKLNEFRKTKTPVGYRQTLSSCTCRRSCAVGALSFSFRVQVSSWRGCSISILRWHTDGPFTFLFFSFYCTKETIH